MTLWHENIYLQFHDANTTRYTSPVNSNSVKEDYFKNLLSRDTLSKVYRNGGEKDTIDQIDLTVAYRIFHPNTAE